MDTASKLDPATLRELQDLTQINLDSRDGFRHSAEHLQGVRVVQLFRELAEERARQATELQHFVAINEEQPKREGSLAAAVHRTWLSIRDAVTGSDDQAVLAEAERGEDQIKSAYESALQRAGNGPVSEVLQRQYAAVKRAHEQVRDLRDSTSA